MISVLLIPGDVHSDDEVMPYTAADLQWWAEQSDRPGPPVLPFADWFECEAATWRVAADDEPTADGEALCELVACHLDGLARSARFHGARSGEELVGAGGLYRRATTDPAALAIPAARHESDLAERLDCIAARYRDERRGPWATLAAWAILQLAEQAESFGSATVGAYLDSEAAFRQAEIEAMYDFDGF